MARPLTDFNMQTNEPFTDFSKSYSRNPDLVGRSRPTWEMTNLLRLGVTRDPDYSILTGSSHEPESETYDDMTSPRNVTFKIHIIIHSLMDKY